MTNNDTSRVDLNSVDQKTLIQVLGISIEQSKHILDLRPYQSIDQLRQVAGMDPETLARILPLVMVQTAQEEPAQPSEIEPQSGNGMAPELIPETNNQADAPAEMAAMPVANRQDEPEQPPVPSLPARKTSWQTTLILLVILLAGAYFRFTGVNWDDNQHQHPDERFISMVAERIRGVNGIGAYFDTVKSTLNPLAFGSYTYGMLPLFLTRFVAEWVKMATYDHIVLVGRVMSGLFDLAAVWMLYLLGCQLYNRRVGLLAAALGAAAVLPIQLSHFFAVDSFSTVFVVFSFYLALLAVPLDVAAVDEKTKFKDLFYFVLFGCVVGLAGACKVSVLPVFGIIVLAGLARLVFGWKKMGFRALLFHILTGWFLAVIFAGLIFRIFQPYAFAGPGFFGIELNQKWLDVIKEVTNQVAGLSEWPPNHQWTNQPITYAWVNMVMWGMGLPLGLAGWAGWSWAGWRIWKGDWRKHLLPFAWVLGYFLWQNSQFWRYMRYFLPVYPFIILFAAWALVELFDLTRLSREKLIANGKRIRLQFSDLRTTWMGAASILGLAIVVLGTYSYAFAFTRIYNEPITRIDASRWILDNIPAPLNLKVQSLKDVKSYPVSISNQYVVVQGETGQSDIHIIRNGIGSEITSTNIRQVGVNFYIRLTRDEKGEDLITDGRLAVADDAQDGKLIITFGDVHLTPGEPVYFHYKIANSSRFSISEVVLRNDDPEGDVLPIDLSKQDQAPGAFDGVVTLNTDKPVRINRLEISQFHQVFVPTPAVLKINIFKEGDDQTPIAEASENLNFSQAGQQLSPTFKFNSIQFIKGIAYQVRYQVVSGGPLRLFGEAYTLETSWDDALPLSVDQLDPFGGIYKPMNLELFQPDTPEKRDAMIKILSESNYIVIPSNRAYDAMPRLPLRYPLTLKYYQTLFDCNCSGDAMENRAYSLQPPFKSPLGFDLVKVFENNPSIGPFSFPDQAADESFTVYDHPKVYIFKKSGDFSIEKVKQVLSSVDLDQVVFQVPLAYTQAPTALQLPADRLADQTSGGTWASMFSRAALFNANQDLGGLAWYVFLLLLGWVAFPLVFTAFPGLPDRGYPLARMAGLIMVAWLAWFVGSYKILQFTQLTIGICITFTLAVNLILAYFKRQALAGYLRSKWKHILVTEAIFLALFLFSLVLRTSNPDLWNPWLGGEKPMDFSYFNATLKAVYFPPENPWFSGHYLNYYYYGYVLTAIPTKLLSIVPSIAYNLILPGWFAMAGVGVFCIGFNLVAGLVNYSEKLTENQNSSVALSRGNPFRSSQTLAYFSGVMALVLVMFLGNLYMVREFWQYLPEAAPATGSEVAPTDQFGGFISGAIQVITGQSPLPGDKGRWYFEASRPILHNGPDTPIAEFPYFTFLYGDLHPHLLIMPVYGLALGWILSLLLLPIVKMKRSDQLFSLILAGLIFGSIRAAHTWDFPTFTGLGALIILLNIWQTKTGTIKQTLGIILGVELAFIGLCLGLYQPFAQWFSTEYVSLEFWTGARTPLFDYLFVFGVALFVMGTLFIRDLAGDIKQFFQAKRAASSRYLWPFLFVLVGLAAMIVLWILDYEVLILGIPFLLGIGYLLFFKPGLSVLQRVIWFLFGVGLSLSLFVEIIVLKGDVGRSNTVFRFYNEIWFIFGIAVSAALVELWVKSKSWPNWLKISWCVVLGLLLLSAGSFAMVATPAKLADRWPEIPNPPITLDGAAFMLGDTSDPNVSLPAFYNDDNRKINLSHDYTGIQYMQEHISGSPVIVEGHTEEYRWGSRYSVYTGLPSVIGWSWHVRQHNSLLDGAVIDKRISDVADFYNTRDINLATQFLKKYHVQYIIVSDLERFYYDTDGLKKFKDMVSQGVLKISFGDDSANTATIFEVLNLPK